ncbi:flagellar protein [Microaerobacter geothermalis]|uniref:TIGR02530 family flagellar biosynthesis protein n=1 Tax=Microaerobacter geothermalis TaxID=674972 RepID=UPI001F45DBD0|nr:TIGR02530 family flagellar biosynthesis protein [Microaerobacter geothermalis]MCF6093832.1 flagellar protein [Microaerobacter geothermalis]
MTNQSFKVGQAFFPTRQVPVQRNTSQPSDQRGEPFSEIFNDRLSNIQSTGIKFSHHAEQRLQLRGIQLSIGDIARLENAVNKAASKGSRESLVFMNNVAYVVNIKNRTVITALDGNHAKENVFTNIDSAVIL